MKNRRKNGDHYWVRANAVPMVREEKSVAICRFVPGDG
ncbi:hypothetical protein ACVV4J_19205 [Escherichia coli]